MRKYEKGSSEGKKNLFVLVVRCNSEDYWPQRRMSIHNVLIMFKIYTVQLLVLELLWG